MPSKKRPPTPRERLRWIVTSMRAKGEYLGTVQARDEAEARDHALALYAKNDHDRARIAVRKEVVFAVSRGRSSGRSPPLEVSLLRHVTLTKLVFRLDW
jgi:hypothetical protein